MEESDRPVLGMGRVMLHLLQMGVVQAEVTSQLGPIGDLVSNGTPDLSQKCVRYIPCKIALMEHEMVVNTCIQWDL